MPLPTDTILTAGTILRVQRSGANRTLPTITVTVGTGGGVIGQTTIPVTALLAPAGLTYAATDVLIQQGSKLTFGATTVTLANDAKVGDTSIVVTTALTAAITAATVATSSGLLQILGLDNLGFTVTDKDVSTRSFENGLFDDTRKVMIGGSIPVSGFYRKGDPAFNQVVLPNALSAGEIYFNMLYPDNDFRAGFARIKGYKEDNKLDDIRRFSFEITAVGSFTFGQILI